MRLDQTDRGEAQFGPTSPDRAGRRVAAAIVAALLALSTRPALSGPLIENGLEAFLTFDEGGGGTTSDLTGNGHTGTLVSTSWESGVITCTGEDQLVSVVADSALRSPTFTYDLWFEASSFTGAYGRMIAQATHSGGDGPDVLENYGYPAVRITSGGDATFLAPSIGSLSTPSPPDHFGICADAFHREDGPEHLVLTHDSASKTVRMFVGLEGSPLRLCFQAQYTGAYSVANGPLAIGNHPDPDHVFRGRYYQFAYYSRTLTYEADGNHNVVGGELLANHQAGADAELATGSAPDAGVPDAGALDAGAGAHDDAGAPAVDGGLPPPKDEDWHGVNHLTGGCATTSAHGGRAWVVLLLLLPIIGARRWRRHQRAARSCVRATSTL